MAKPIDSRNLDAAIMEAVRGTRRKKIHYVLRKPPKPESAKAAGNVAKKVD